MSAQQTSHHQAKALKQQYFFQHAIPSTETDSLDPYAKIYLYQLLGNYDFFWFSHEPLTTTGAQ